MVTASLEIVLGIKSTSVDVPSLRINLPIQFKSLNGKMLGSEYFSAASNKMSPSGVSTAAITLLKAFLLGKK